MFGVWRIEVERGPRWWRHYYCAADAAEGGEEFRLECEWCQPVYLLTVTSRSRGPDDLLFGKMLYSDADCGWLVRRVLRLARRDVARRLARLGALHQDLFLHAQRGG